MVRQSEPVILHSARRHGITDPRHAVHNPIDLRDMDEGMTMFIGADRASRLLEVGVVDSDDGPVIVHAMRARDKFL